MVAFNCSFRAVLASITILSGTALSIVFTSNTFINSASAAKKNFAAKCERVYSDRSVKALAIGEPLSYQQACICARTNREFRRQLGASGISCTNNQITNFNQPVSPSGEPGPGPGPDPSPALKGNNGFGNLGEGVNKGSFKGKTADTKSPDTDGTGVR
jgi:hypothetical protein